MHTLLNSSALSHQTRPVASAELALTLLGPSTAMSQLWSQLRRLAPHVRTVLLTGNPDCGQEAAARLLLDLSPYPRRPFLALNQAEAEAHLARSSGLHLVPNEAFLFLPEADRLSPAAQQGLLRLLRIRRSRALSVIAAVSEDLRALVGTGRLSAELAEALGTVRVSLPDLHERAEDLPMLLSQMLSLRSHALQQPVPQLSEEVLRAAMQHTWPGNLRELADVVDGLIVGGAAGEELRAACLQRALRAVGAPKPGVPPVRMIKLDTVVQEHIFSVLRGCRGNKLRAAEVLGISRSTLYRILDAAAQSRTLPLAS